MISRRKLAEENQRRLDEQEAQRQLLESQRKANVEKGDFKALLVDTSSGVGRGRGRVVTNLPAWITQKMETESAIPVAQDSDSYTAKDEVKDSRNNSKDSKGTQQSSETEAKKKLHVRKPSTVVLLKNMVSVQEVDEGFKDEVTGECEKYGAVNGCKVRTLRKVFKTRVFSFPL